MRLRVQHRSTWRYPAPALLGPQLIRLRPASHTRIGIDDYQLTVTPPGDLRRLQDPVGNHLVRLTYPLDTRVTSLDVLVRFSCDVHTVNPFDFLVDPAYTTVPFRYDDDLHHDLAPYLSGDAPAQWGSRFAAFVAAQPAGGDTVPLLVEWNRAVQRAIAYLERQEPGIHTPDETLTLGRGSCRDSALVLLALLRRHGIAARFVSGYLIQLANEASVAGEASTVTEDSVALHAWVEAYLPGAGWIGFDTTSGLLCGEGHIPLACVSVPERAAPIDGTSDLTASDVSFTMHVERVAPSPP